MKTLLHEISSTALLVAWFAVPLWVLFYGHRRIGEILTDRKIERTTQRALKGLVGGDCQWPEFVKGVTMAESSTDIAPVKTDGSAADRSQDVVVSEAHGQIRELAAKVDRLERSLIEMEKRLRGSMMVKGTLPSTILGTLATVAAGVALLAWILDQVVE